MTYKEETYLLDTVTEINDKLSYLIQVSNAYLINHQQENSDDFNRNVLANLMSQLITSQGDIK